MGHFAPPLFRYKVSVTDLSQNTAIRYSFGRLSREFRNNYDHASIKSMESGPYVIAGTAVYVDIDGNEQTTPGKAIALCRCGGSSKKPFCDGTHNKIDFKAEEIILQLED